MKPDNLRRKFYKNFCKLDCAVVMWQPHQFGAVTNFGIPYTKVDIHSKHFDRFHELKDYLLDLFPDSHEIDLNDFNISRIELHSDIESLPLDIVLARLWVIGYRRESVSFYKGKTIYIGTDPKIRIFNKNSQLLRKLGKTGKLTENELQLMNGKPITRFSIEIGQLKMNLNQLVNDPKQLASYFDRFKFYNFEDDESINRVGGFQILMSKIRREHRKSFDQFKDRELERLIQRNFKSSIRAWFKKEAIEKPISIKAKLIQEAKRFNRILSTGMIE
ncbi:MAG: hypothetical protein G3M78_04765 [Candidatus Nitrohelix vancouverensis]|uniref:Uncharacterized protein n=1 Tax=Candidatus Nitrohelix vancouverensis TaxID=2705534 RepID=A0A7T0C1F1_9BACT|nr:MAG: hypothetical protein G3M78_04765 [Candidatus Nitrohelix vancouverensis]